MAFLNNLKSQLKKRFIDLLWNIASLAIFISLIIGGVYVYAAFVEPASAPSASSQDFAQNILGANNANNSFDSSSVAANNDGSIIERLEYLWSNRTSFGSTSLIGTAADAASMATTLFAGQQYLWDNRASFGLSWAGFTGSATTGNLGNLMGANTKCNTAYSGSHWASYDEIMKLGTSYPATYSVWVRDAYAGEYYNGTNTYVVLKDGGEVSNNSSGTCVSWTNGTGSYGGSYMGASDGSMSRIGCDNSFRLACVYGS